MKSEILTIGSRQVLRFTKGKNGPVLYHPVHKDSREQFEHMASLIARYAPGCGFTLVSAECGDWNADYSPWAAQVEGREAFTGKGMETLAFYREELIPAIERDSRTPRCIGGYSLAGLFALWAFYETDLFSGAAACSPSVWFPGWDAYREQHSAHTPGIVYLSLGDKEERTRNPVMCRVGEAIRSQYAALLQDPGIRESALVMHPGGHGSQADVRMAQGFAWLLKNQ